LEQQERLCDTCEERQRQKQNEAAAEKNKEAGLPVLTGSEKQIAWAESIRDQYFANIKKALDGDLDRLHLDIYWGFSSSFSSGAALAPDHQHVNHTVSVLAQQSSARWWIDHRQTKIGYLLAELLINNPPPVPETPEISTAREEAERQATVRPEVPVTETVAEIRVLESSVEIYFPEKRDDFWQIVKKQLSYSWTGRCWKRDINQVVNGSPADRAAEAGNRLLSAGFVVRIFDDAVRDAAINASFATECTRWIFGRRPGRDYAGWLAINWQERDEELYRQARRLPGSRYDKPSVVVPVEHFEQVLDFAETHGFGISPFAQEVIDQARADRDAALVARPDRPEETTAPAAGRPHLNPSDAGEIDADLLDD
jgi:hypothetical protein